MSAVNDGDEEPDYDDCLHHYQTMSLTDDQKVMEQTGYCHLYQDIDSDPNEADRDHIEDDTSDDYECIEEIKATNIRASDNNDGTEWRVLSRLELREIGEDWRIVSTLPRHGRQETPWQPGQVRRREKVKDAASEEAECKHLSIMLTNNVNNVAGPECVNDKSFLEKLQTKNSEDLYLSEADEGEATGPDSSDTGPAPAYWLRKQVTFGKLFIFSSDNFFSQGAKDSSLCCCVLFGGQWFQSEILISGPHSHHGMVRTVVFPKFWNVSYGWGYNVLVIRKHDASCK